MSKTKKIIAVVASLVVIIVAAAGIWVLTSVEKGSCGENVRYKYNGITDTLVISGEGPMADYDDPYDFYNENKNETPFHELYNIKKVIIEEGITYIGKNAFARVSEIRSITIPESVTSIGSFAFKGCYELPEISIPATVTDMGYAPFGNCS